MKFDLFVPHVALNRLQRISDDCWKLLHIKGLLFDIDTISDTMPAFVTTLTSTKGPQIQVKYPTYKIEIYSPDKYTDEIELDKQLKDIPGHSRVCAEKIDYYIIGNEQIHESKHPFIFTVTCLKIDIDDNKKVAERIKEKATQMGYSYNVYPSYCLRPADVEMCDDNKHFKVLSDDIQ